LLANVLVINVFAKKIQNSLECHRIQAIERFHTAGVLEGTV
jgi:hypothetical protein